LPKSVLYIMLRVTRTFQIVFASLISISIFTFQIPASTDIKENTAEEYRELGYLEHAKGNLNGALTYYNKAIALGLESADVYNDLGILYEQIGLDSKAESLYLRAVAVDQGYLASYTNIAFLYLNNGRRDKAFNYFKKRFELGEEGDVWTEAAKDELLKINPHYEHWIVANEAEKLNKELVEKSRRDFALRVERANDHFQKGKNFEREGKLNKALLHYNYALRFTPQYPKIKEAREQIIIEMTRLDVEKHTQEALKFLSLGDSSSAKREFQKILTKIPKDSE